MEARGEKINVSSGPSKEIAGLKKMNTVEKECYTMSYSSVHTSVIH